MAEEPGQAENQRVSSEIDTTTYDTSREEPPFAFLRRYKPQTRPSDLPYERERKRGQIALMLVWLLIGTIAATFITTSMRNVDDLNIGGLSIPDAKEILTIIFAPLVALVGTVTGFYYGGKPEFGKVPEVAVGKGSGTKDLDDRPG